MPQSDAGLARLPKWAQRHIENLERSLAHERGRLAIGTAESNTFADPHAEQPRPLGRDTLIRHQLGDHLYNDLEA